MGFFYWKRNIYITAPLDYTWKRVMESAASSDTVLKAEQQLTLETSPDQKFAYEERNGIIIRQYSSGFSIAYDDLLKGMIERRMRQSIFSVASFWYTAWVDAGQPDLREI